MYAIIFAVFWLEASQSYTQIEGEMTTQGQILEIFRTALENKPSSCPELAKL